MVINISIKSKGKIVADEFTSNNTTLVENAIVIRRLEEIKQKLLQMEYESEFEAEEDG